MLISDLLLLTMSEKPLADEEKVQGITEAVSEVRPDLRVVPVIFRPRPVGEVRGLKVAYVSTAPGAVLEKLCKHLEVEYDCEVVAASGALSDRRRLDLELEEVRGLGVEAYLTEIKAAAVDVVTRRGAEEGKPVFYCDNDPMVATNFVVGKEDSLDKALLKLAQKVAGERRGVG